MAVYSSTVSTLEAAPDVPEEARLGAHHVRGANGETIRFRNRHPSAGVAPPSTFAMLRKILWYASPPPPAARTVLTPPAAAGRS